MENVVIAHQDCHRGGSAHPPVGRRRRRRDRSTAWCGRAWSAEDQWVRIERQDDPAASPNDQPVTLDAATVTNALGALRVRDGRSGHGREITTGSVHACGGRQSRAPSGGRPRKSRAPAGPHVQYDRQQSVRRRPDQRPSASTAGVSSIEDGKLNVIFGELQANYRKKNVMVAGRGFRAAPAGNSRTSQQAKMALPTLPGIALHASRRRRSA